MPLEVFSLTGMGIAIVSFAFVIYMFLRRLVIGPEVEGVFTLFALVFFLLGLCVFAIGLLGEYVGRIYNQVRERPRYLVRTVFEEANLSAENDEVELDRDP